MNMEVNRQTKIINNNRIIPIKINYNLKYKI
jgi:hypothetical protein